MTTSPKQSARLFYALWPDDATRAVLMRLQAPLDGRKTPDQNFHLTLAFFGQQALDLLPSLTSILGNLPQQSITLMLDRIGYFEQNKIAWAGTHSTPAALSALHGALIEILAQNSIAFVQPAQFRPHITLARHAVAPGEWPFQSVVWKCETIALIESIPHPGGVDYRVLASQPLMRDIAR